MRRTALFLALMIAALVVLIEARKASDPDAGEAPVQVVTP